MQRKWSSQEQIITILKEHEAGAKVVDLVCKYNVSEQSINRWRPKFGCMKVSEAKRLRQLAAENAKL